MRLLQDLIQSYEKQDATKFKNVEIATVDGFQGREKEVFMLNLGLLLMSGTSSRVLPPSDSIQLINSGGKKKMESFYFGRYCSIFLLFPVELSWMRLIKKHELAGHCIQHSSLQQGRTSWFCDRPKTHECSHHTGKTGFDSYWKQCDTQFKQMLVLLAATHGKATSHSRQ